MPVLGQSSEAETRGRGELQADVRNAVLRLGPRSEAWDERG